MSSGRGANLFSGTMHFLYIALFSVLLPMMTLTYLSNLSIEGVVLSFGQEDFNTMMWWLYRTGIIMAAFAFFKGMSPKYSRRRAIGGLLETAANVFYIFMYRFSGTSDIHLVGPGLFINLNMDQLLALYMGMILLYIVYNIWDLIDTHFFARERAEKDIKKQMEKKWKKLMKKKGYVPPAKKAQETNPLTSALSESKIPPTPTIDSTKEEDSLE